MGSRGPTPRREAERRRRNKPETGEIAKIGPDVLADLPFEIDWAPEPPDVAIGADEEVAWHPMITEFWESMKRDPARQWMTAGDWAATMLFCETMSRELRDQVVGVTQTGEAVFGKIPPKAGTLTAFLKLLEHIGVTESARLRIQKEVTLFPLGERDDAEVRDIAGARRAAVQ